MVALVELEVVKARLLIDFDSSDNDLDGIISAASEMVLNYLKVDHDTYDGSDAEIPAAIVTATLLLIGILYRDRDGKDWQKWEPGYLPAPVRAILYPLRDPALA